MIKPAEDPGDYREQMEALDREFADLLRGRLEEIEALWRDIAGGDWTREKTEALSYRVHILSGSSASFGYPDLGQAAITLEKHLKPWAHLERPPAERALQDAAPLVGALRDSARLRTWVEPISVPRAASEASERRLVYLVEDDKTLAKELSLTLSSFDYEVEVFADRRGVARAIAVRRPDVLVVDIILPQGDLAGVALLEDLREKMLLRDLPVVLITARSDIEARLAAARFGGAAYFVKPLDVVSLVDRLNLLTLRRPVQPFRILIVDDDRPLAEHYALVLRASGMQVTVVTRPLEILDRLDEAMPDLVLMDVNMPECTGIELVSVVRQFDRYLSLPIVYLSTETDLELQLQALRTGGDDFLTKPLSDHHLIAAVEIRAKRSRDLRALMTRDSLTDLLGHVPLKEHLAGELARARRSGEKLAFAMLDIDDFKQVNDRHGHLAGDRVLRSLAGLLRQRVRLSDTVGRYGGEEFGIVLPNCGLDHGMHLLEELRESFSQIRFQAGRNYFHVTFSAGLAAGQRVMAVEALIDRADKALYRAKQSGRNMVVMDLDDG